MKRRHGSKRSAEPRRGLARGLRGLLSSIPVLLRAHLISKRASGTASDNASTRSQNIGTAPAGSKFPTRRRTAVLADQHLVPDPDRTTSPQPVPVSSMALRQAVRDVTLAGLDEAEVLRHMEALGARREAMVVHAQPKRFVRHEWDGPHGRETIRVASTMRLAWPRQRSFIVALFVPPATIMVDFDTEGRAAGGSVTWPKSL